MKKLFYIAFLLIFFLNQSLLIHNLSAQSVSYGKNKTIQIPNLGFEEFETEGAGVVPIGWHSFYSATGSVASMATGKRIQKKADKRPGSTGLYCADLFSTITLSIKANGNITTGRINAGSTTAKDKSNYNWTDRTNAYAMPFTSIPDSVIVWVKKLGYQNKDFTGKLSIFIHNDSDFADGYGTNGNGEGVVIWDNAVAKASIRPTGYNGEWVRYSAPFSKEFCRSEDARYILITLTNNQTPGGGNGGFSGEGDHIYFDDLLFIYNPSISIDPIYQNRLAVSSTEVSEVKIPFQITGIMSPNNLDENGNAWYNEVRMELSDAQGSWEHPLVLGELTTDESGVLSCTIPAALTPGTNYRLRMITTNYPLVYEYPENITLSYEVSIEALPNEAQRGSIQGTQGLVVAGTQITLNAVPAEGNRFMGWKENDVFLEGVGNAYSFRAGSSRKLTAVFDTITYTVHLNYAAHFGTVSGGGVYPFEQSTVTLEAKPSDPNFNFSRFSVRGENISSNPYTFDIEPLAENMEETVSVIFDTVARQINVSVSNPEKGSFTSGDGLIKHYRITPLKASPYNGYTAVWTKDGSEIGRGNTLNYQVLGDADIVLRFEANTNTVSLQNLSGTNGSMGIKDGEKPYATNFSHTVLTDEVFTIEATANNGFSFICWRTSNVNPSDYRNAETRENAKTLTTNANYTRYAQFAPSNTVVSLSAVSIPENAGYFSGNKSGSTTNTILRGPGNYINSSTNNANTAGITANPNANYRIVQWNDSSGNFIIGKTNAEYGDFTITKNTVLEAVFAPANQYVLLSLCEPKEAGNLSYYQSFEQNTQGQLSVSSNYGYTFQGWYDLSDNLLASTTDAQILMNGDKNVKAKFRINQYSVSADASDEKFGSVSGDMGMQNYKTAISLQAKPKPYCRFVEWQKEGLTYSMQSSISFDLTEDIILTAIFAADSFAITTAVYPSMAGSVNAKEKLSYFDEISLSASAEDFFEFLHFKDEENIIYAENPFLISGIHTNKTYTAVFDTVSHTLNVLNEHPSWGSVSGAGLQKHFTTYYLQASPSNSWFAFEKWTNADGSLVLGTDTKLELPCERDSSIKATFIVAAMPKVDIASSDAERGLVKFTKDGSFVENTHAEYIYGTQTSIEAEGLDIYQFLHWVNAEGKKVSENNPYLFSIQGDTSLFAVFTAKAVRVNAEVFPENSGSVKGTGLYDFNQRIELIPSPALGYHFKAWVNTEGDSICSDNPYSLIVSDDTLLRAVFELNTYTVLLSCDNEKGSLNEIPAQAQHFEQINLSVQPKYGYLFKGWYSGNALISTQSEMRIEINKDTNLRAEFTPIKYQVNAQALPSSFGSIEGIGSFDYKTEVEMVAKPNTPYHFKEWRQGENLVSTEASIQFTLTQDSSFTAVFYTDTFTILTQVLPSMGGSVNEIEKLPRNARFTLKARENKGYHFVGWEKGEILVSEDSEFTGTALENATYTAIFEKNQYTLSTQSYPSGLEEFISEGGSYYFEDSVELEAQNPVSHHFVHWEYDGKTFTDPKIRLQITEDASATAIYQINAYPIFVNQRVGGNILPLPSSVNHGDEIDLSIELEKHYSFKAWYDDSVFLSNLPNYRLKVEKAMSIHAKVDLNTYTILANASPSAYGTTEGAGNYPYGQSVHLKATAKTGYVFSQWKSKNLFVADSAEISFISHRDTSFTAVFVPDTFLILTEAFPIQGGRVNTVGKLPYLSAFHLTATPNQGYRFVEWQKEGESVNYESDFQSIATENAQYTAVFERIQYTLSLQSNPVGLNIKGGGKYNAYDTIVLEVGENEGMEFSHWSFSGTPETAKLFTEEDLNRKNLRFPCIENLHITADFKTLKYTISADVFPLEGGHVSNTGNYPYGISALLTAIPAYGYVFKEWKEADSVYGLNANLSFPVTYSRHFTAVFERKFFSLDLEAYRIEGGDILVNGENKGAKFGGEFAYQSSVSLGAIPKESYIFAGWIDEKGKLLSTHDSLQVLLTKNAFYTALFNKRISTENDRNTAQTRLYPNPCENGFTLASENAERIELYSLGGFCVWKQNLKEGSTYVDIQSLPKGIFIYRIINRNGETENGKIVKL